MKRSRRLRARGPGKVHDEHGGLRFVSCGGSAHLWSRERRRGPGGADVHRAETLRACGYVGTRAIVSRRTQNRRGGGRFDGEGSGWGDSGASLGASLLVAAARLQLERDDVARGPESAW